MLLRTCTLLSAASLRVRHAPPRRRQPAPGASCGRAGGRRQMTTVALSLRDVSFISAVRHDGRDHAHQA
jgi:hypothetical protein